MKGAIICLVLISLQPLVKAQIELVPNGDFESYSLCPVGPASIEFYTNPYVNNWLRASEGTPDFFHSCTDDVFSIDVPSNIFFHYQPAHSGEAYGGIVLYVSSFEYREYLQDYLPEPMIAGQCYFVEFYTAPSERGGLWDPVATDRIGLHIGVEREFIGEFGGTGPLDIIPQIVSTEGVFITDTMNWTKVFGVYVAEGGEQWITIGNFLNDAETNIYEFLGDVASGIAYYAIDDLSISSLTVINTLPDTVVCAGESLILEAVGGATSYSWNTGDTTSSIIIDSGGTYIVSLNFPCGTYNDTSVVLLNNSSIEYTSLELDLCADELPYTLVASDYYESYLWNTGVLGSAIWVTEPGTYFVQGYVDCATYIDTFIVNIYDEISDVELPDTVLICEVNGIVDISGPDGFDTYTWNTGETTPSIAVTGNGIFTVTYSKDCDTYSHAYQVITDAYLELELNLPESLVVCPFDNPVAVLDAEVGFPEYNWSTGANTAAISVTEPGVYVVTATTLCRTVIDSTTVTTCQVMTVPNAFTPNADGVNDLFYAICNPCDGFLSLSIFNRWGELIFETNNPTIGWDGNFEGKPVELGAYSYVLRFDGPNGAEVLQGNLMVVK